MKIVTLNEQTKQNLLESLLKRSTNDYGEYEKIVDDIIQNVKTRKEEAIFEYSLKFDKCELTKDSFKVTRDEIDAAYNDIGRHACGEGELGGKLVAPGGGIGAA